MDGRTETLLAQASAHMSAGQVAEAERAFNATLDLDPNEHRAHLGIADCVAARGLTDWAVDHLVEHARGYGSRSSMRAAFSLMTKAIALAPARLDLHVDIAELEALDGRPEMAALRLENLARTYRSTGQGEEAELVLAAAESFRTPEEIEEPTAAPFINPHDGRATPAPTTTRRSAPPPPPASRVVGVPTPVMATPTPIHPVVRPSPLRPPAPPAPRRAAPPPPRKPTSRSGAPRWRPSTVKPHAPANPRASASQAPTPAPKPNRSVKAAPKPKATPKPKAVARPKPTPSGVKIAKPPRPAKVEPKTPALSIAVAPSPKRGGKKLDKLPPLKDPRSLASRLRTTASRAVPPTEDDRTTMWRPTP